MFLKMKPFSRKILALVLIFLVVGDDLGIQVKAKADFIQALKSPSLKQKTERKMNMTDSESHKPGLKSQKHLLSTKVRRLKETERKSLTEVQTKDFGLTLLIIAGLVIIFTAVKYFMNKAVEKQLNFLKEEKYKVVSEQYYQDIQEGFFNSEYCLSLQSLSKLFKFNLLQRKLYEEDLSQSLKALEQQKSLKPDALITTSKEYLEKLKDSKISSTMIDECYNTYKFRKGWEETESSPANDKNAEGLEIIDLATKAVDQSLIDASKEIVKYAVSGDNFEMAKKYNEAVNDKEFKTEKHLDDNDKPLTIHDFFAIAGNIPEIFLRLYEFYVFAFQSKDEPVILKVCQGISWIFKTTSNILKSIGDIQKLSGSQNFLNIPFFSLGASVVNCIEKGLIYRETKKIWKEEQKKPDTDPNKNLAETELNKRLAEIELWDEIIDFFESLITTTTKWFAPLTAGLSEVFNQCIKLIAQIIHILFAAHKMDIISNLGKKIIEVYHKKIIKKQADFVIYKEKLLNRRCGSAFALVNSYLQDEFAEIDQKLENSKLLLKKVQDEKPLSDYEVTDKVLTILGIICEADVENCLGFLSSKEFNLDLKTLENSGNTKAHWIAYSISKNAKFGPINSVFMLSKIFDLNSEKLNEQTKEFLKGYIPKSHELLIKNGYYPIFQGLKTELWGCRICGNPFYELQSITQGHSLQDINTKFHQRQAIIQESVEGINRKSLSTESATSFFVAEYRNLEKIPFNDLGWYSILPTFIDDKETLKLFKETPDDKKVNNELQAHDRLVTCTTKLKDKYSKELLEKLKYDYKIPILSTIVHPGEKYGDDHKVHTFLTVMFSYENQIEKLKDFAITLSIKHKIYCYDISKEIFDYRHNHFVLVVKKKIPGVNRDDPRTTSTEDFNINEKNLIDSGWISFEKKLSLKEITFIEGHDFKKDEPYKFHVEVYMKELIKLNPDPNNPPNMKKTLELLTNSENKKEVKKSIISGLKELYCTPCKELDQNTPLKVTRGSSGLNYEGKPELEPNLDLNFCKLEPDNSEGNKILKYIKSKAKQSISSDSDKNEICSTLREIKSDFSINNPDKEIDNKETCVSMLEDK